MSYPQFGYTYPSSTQILVSGSQSPCCQPQPGEGSTPTPTAYDSRLLTQIPRLASFGLYAGTTTYDISTLANNSAFYSTLPSPYELKESRTSWNAALQQSAACYPYDPCNPYSDRYSSMESAARRKNATRETTNTLKAWLYEHRKNPYPTKGEKIMLAIITKMTLTQVSTWFANARRRLKKENKMTWEPRNKTSDDRDSSSPREAKSDDTTDGSLNDFLKQESATYTDKDTSYNAVDNNTASSRTSFPMDCYRAHSSEDSMPSDTSSPSCYTVYQPGKDDKKGGFTPHNAFHSSSRPKIWSLARTATSNSPPTIRRPLLPCQMDFCFEKGQKPPEMSSCPVLSFSEYMPESRTRDQCCNKTAMDSLSCDNNPVANHSVNQLCRSNKSSDDLMSNCDDATAPKNKECLSSSSCMLDRHPFPVDFAPSSLGGSFMYDTKSKVAINYEEPSVGNQSCDKSTPYPNSRPEFFDSAQCKNAVHQKCCSNTNIVPNSDLTDTNFKQNKL